VFLGELKFFHLFKKDFNEVRDKRFYETKDFMRQNIIREQKILAEDFMSQKILAEDFMSQKILVCL
jgi:hypothetical protein